MKPDDAPLLLRIYRYQHPGCSITEARNRDEVRSAMPLVDGLLIHLAAQQRSATGFTAKPSAPPANDAIQPPKVLAGKDGRRKHVQDRYQQLAQEQDSAGCAVYPSQQKIIEKLAEELNISERTLKEDIKWLRNQKRLPPLPSRTPKELTNRMSRINPTRSTPT